MSNNPYQKLFEPGKIGKMVVKNRIVMPPITINAGSTKGFVSQRTLDYYEARARGGAGLIIVEGTSEELRGRGFFTQLALMDDRYIPGFRRLAEVVHRHGAKIAVQLLHNGMVARPPLTGQSTVAPSPIAFMGGEPAHELTIPEIAEIENRFATAALRAKKAGFDGVEIHGAHGFLVSEFLSSAFNRRTDSYGGSIENKARFLIEIIRQTKKAVGADFPVWSRLSAQEYGIKGGITLEETKQVVRMAEEAGIDAVNVSCFGYGEYDHLSMPYTPGLELPLSAEIKKAVSVPVMAVGWLNPEVGERALAAGQADFICMGRRILADPELPNKAFSGRMADVRPCLGCNECLQAVVFNGGSIRCAVNASIGQERQYSLKPASRKKKVIVIGGGPAGMEAARVAAARGHKVILFEKNNQLGGTLNLAALPPQKEPLAQLVRYLTSQVTQLGVDIRCGVEATVESILKIRPDAVVVAGGAVPAMPSIRGIDWPNVFTAIDILAEKASAGPRVAIIGGGMVGCETAHYLASRGHTVTVVEILETLASDLEVAAVRQRLMTGINEKGVRQITSAECQEIMDGAIRITNRDGKAEVIPAHTVVVAVGSRSKPDLYRALRGNVPEIYQIGDAQQPARILEAMESGLRTGFAL
jgi:2,4-dienoyl-CoA reductase-like NADH-dependent reductase (Old Yellow Enzyme family)/thioredoxin reductase